MSDQKLRDLERRWKETGIVEDEAAYLLERVRVGDLSRERLELAAYCGHEGAKVAVPDTLPADDDLERFALGLLRWGRTYAVVAAVAACHEASLHSPKLNPEARRILEFARQWLANPTRESEDRANRSAWRLERSPDAGPYVATARLLRAPIDLLEEWVIAAVLEAAEGVDLYQVNRAMRTALVGWALKESLPLTSL